MRYLVLLLIGVLSIPSSIGQTLPSVGVAEPITPLSGPLMLAGKAELSMTSMRTFAWLAKGKQGRLVIFYRGDAPRDLDRWKTVIGKVIPTRLDSKSQAGSDAILGSLDNATGVWFNDDVTPFALGTAFEQRLVEVSYRGGPIGGRGTGAQSLGQWIVDANRLDPGFAMLPQSVIRILESDPLPADASEIAGSSKDDQASDDLADGRARIPVDVVTWDIPPSGVMVVHEGRQVGVIGDAEITARVAANNGWPERVETFGSRVIELPHMTDLVSWTRSAQSRNQPVFPPANPPEVEVPDGTLILIGGGGSTDDMWSRMIEAAGGVDANFVCMPQSPDSFSARKLRGLGCKNVTVLFSDADLREKANSDPAFLKPLETADGIFLGGGRTYRFMDAYQNTTVHELMRGVLQRGGVIAGTSAGAQIQGDFLVRGDPRTNQTLWYPGNDTGFAFLRGVIVDVHFAERERQRSLPTLLNQHRQMLGMGIDEATAVVVQGNVAEVLGRGAAWFYDSPANNDSERPSPLVLKAGETYDLKQRKAIP